MIVMDLNCIFLVISIFRFFFDVLLNLKWMEGKYDGVSLYKIGFDFFVVDIVIFLF